MATLDNLKTSSTSFALVLLLAACAGSSSGGPAASYVAVGADAGTPAAPTTGRHDTAIGELDASQRRRLQPLAPTRTAARVATEPKDESAKSTACPDGMVLIDGDYCTNLDMTCLKSTYAPQNKKTIC